MSLKRSVSYSKRILNKYSKCHIIRNYNQSIIHHPKPILLSNISTNCLYNNFIRHCSSTKPENDASNMQQQQSESPQSQPEKQTESPEYEHEHIPEVPEGGRRLFRDAILTGIIALFAAWTWTVYKQKRDKYDDKTLDDVYSVRAHIEYAMKTNDIDVKMYHLSEAEKHCRLALEDLGGGYLSKSDDDDTSSPSAADGNKIKYNPEIVALHVQLGKICYISHKYRAAIDNYLIVLKALTQEFGYKSRELIMPCRQISDCYMNLGQYQMSALFLERALSVINEITVSGGDNTNKANMSFNSHPEYAPICQQMAVLLRKQFKWEESMEYTNKAIKGAKLLLGDKHIQIAHMLLGRACCEMELGQWRNAEKSARKSLEIVEYGSHRYSQSTQQYMVKEESSIFSGNDQDKIVEGGIKNTLKNTMKSNMTANKTPQEMEFEKEMEMQQQRKQIMSNASLSGISSIEQLIEMKCSILYVIGQSLIEQGELDEASMIFNNALLYAGQLNDTSKQLLIHDQLRDIKIILKQKQEQQQNG